MAGEAASEVAVSTQALATAPGQAVLEDFVAVAPEWNVVPADLAAAAAVDPASAVLAVLDKASVGREAPVLADRARPDLGEQAAPDVVPTVSRRRAELS